MDKDQQKVHWQGEVVSVQPRSTVWRYLTDNRTHRECGYNIFFKGEVMCDSEILPCESVSDKYDLCVERRADAQQSWLDEICVEYRLDPDE